MEKKTDILIITLDGNIGAGKSTFLNEISKAIPEVEIVLEPVGVWEKLISEDGKSLLANFYCDPKRWGYTFQNCAILTRIIEIKKAMETTHKKIIITERSVLTDIHVFAKINHDIGNINSLEWDLYMKWVNNFAYETPVHAAIHLTTSVETSVSRIKSRARNGEQEIPLDYLEKLEKYHNTWLDNTDIPVIKISTELNQDKNINIDKVKVFISELIKLKNNM